MPQRRRECRGKLLRGEIPGKQIAPAGGWPAAFQTDEKAKEDTMRFPDAADPEPSYQASDEEDW